MATEDKLDQILTILSVREQLLISRGQKLDSILATLNHHGQTLAAINLAMSNIILRLDHMLTRLDAMSERGPGPVAGGASDTGPQESL